MELLPLEWEEVEGILRDLPDFRPLSLTSYFEKKGVHFFKVRYSQGEVIIPQGVHSDFAGVLLQGNVEVYRRRAPLRRNGHVGERSGLEQCWNRPGRLIQRLESWVLDDTDRRMGQTPDVSTLGARSKHFATARLRALIQALEDAGKVPTHRAGEARWRRVRRWVVRRLFGWSVRRSEERRLGNPPTMTTGHGGSHGEPLPTLHAHDADGDLLPILDRFVGVTGALWNVQRSASLVAQPSPGGKPCQLLLIKRRVLLDIEEKCAAFRLMMREQFLAHELSDVLAENRLFRNTLYDADVANWPRLWDLLRKHGKGPKSAAVRRINSFLDAETKGWLATRRDGELGPQDRHQMLGGLNGVLKRPDLYSRTIWRERELGATANQLVARRHELTENEVTRLNRLLVEAAYGDALRPGEPFRPVGIRDIQQGTAAAKPAGAGEGIALRHYDEGAVIYEEGTRAQALFLIVSGTVRVTKRSSGGEMLVNQLERHGYFGVTCIRKRATHSATVQALTSVNAVVLGRDVFVRLFATDRVVAKTLARKLRNELVRIRRRDAQLASIERLPPPEPPEEIVSKLLLATNLLRIDMDRCTRCDQCVRACASAHDGVPRFHRSNPDLHFGQWEVAAGCVHCRDAPCQTACPFGAITFLDDGTVHVHHNRCTGCGVCVPACPFNADFRGG
jgi:CRP-like cAMP-binding protein/NAD-dependent dihydropyrimidine dehydrogenase PreA subunit